MRFFKRQEVQIPLSFLIISTLWIVFSDELFLTIQTNISAAKITEIQTIKGSFFVVVVTFLIHLMIKISNKRLAKSEEEYKDLFCNTPNPMLVLNLKTNKFCDVNKAALDTYGYTAKEFSRMSVGDIRAEFVAEKFPSNCRQGNVVEHKKKNRQSITCIELSREISFKSSSAQLLSVIDITELEKTKFELAQRETQLNQVLKSITDGFFILSHDLVVTKANDHFKRMLDLDADYIEGQNLSHLLPGIKESGSYDQYVWAINSKEPVHFDRNYKKLKKWFRVSAYPFDNGLSVFFRDITKEKEDEIQRQQNEQNLLSLINNTEDLMWSVDCNFKYFIFNEPYKENYRRIFGEDVFVGKCALNEKQGQEHMQKWKALYERALNGVKHSVNMDFVIDDTSYFTTIQLNPIYDTTKNIIGVSCFLRDITKSKLQMRKIEQQNEQLKRIAFITSHKVRVPLANILGLSEILDKDDPLSASNCKIIEHIKTSAQQLDVSIINMVQQTVDAHD